MTFRSRTQHAALGALVLICVAATVLSTPYAVEVIDVQPGEQSSGLPDEALGSPSGAGLFEGTFDAYTLGVGGSITLRLDSPAIDAAGTDLIVCENPFYVIGSLKCFVEAVFVEVSTDGDLWVQFPTSFTGPPGPYAPFTGVTPAWYGGFAGVLPVTANPGAFDPLDVVAAGGDAFDLAELADDPLVLSGDVNLQDIRYVRLTDVDSGDVTDDAGAVIWDAGIDEFSSADIDAVVAVHNQDNLVFGQPRVEMQLSDLGFLSITIEDDEGLFDIKTGLVASVDGFEIPFTALLPFFLITDVSSTSFTLEIGPIPAGTFPTVLKVGARDLFGRTGGDAITIQ